MLHNAELSISDEEALDVARVLRETEIAVPASELLRREKNTRGILTFCGELDRILDNGVSLGQITEFCGAPAVGKTQLGIQLAIDVQIPRMFGGVEGEAVYIDTEGSFFPERVKRMAEAFVKHIKKMAAASPDAHQRRQQQAAVDGLSWEAVADRIHYFRVLDLAGQFAILGGLESYVREHPQVKLVVMDSLAFLLRQDIEDMGQRTRRLLLTGQGLARLAEIHDVGVVLMNHMTTKIGVNEARIVPALGDTWAHVAANRVILRWKGDRRVAEMFKSRSLPPKEADFEITEAGVRDKRAPHK